MSKQEFHLEITARSVNVQLSAPPGQTRLRAFILFSGMAGLATFGPLLLPGRDGYPSLWQDFSGAPWESGEFLFLCLVLLAIPSLMFPVLSRYLIFTWPSDETFDCDPSTLKIARVRWLDFSNARSTFHSFPLSEVRDLRYRAIARLRERSVYGLRFRAGGKKWRVLPGLKPRDAERILAALKSFGAEVPDDPVLPQKLREAAASE